MCLSVRFLLEKKHKIIELRSTLSPSAEQHLKSTAKGTPSQPGSEQGKKKEKENSVGSSRKSIVLILNSLKMHNSESTETEKLEEKKKHSSEHTECRSNDLRRFERGSQ